MTANEIREAYNKHTLYLFFTNVVPDNVDPGEGEVQASDAMKILYGMPDNSNDYGDLVPVQSYQDWTADEMFQGIEGVAEHFMNFHPEAS